MLTRKQAIQQALGRSGLTICELSDKVPMSRSTLSRKLQEPELFTLKEIEDLNNILEFTKTELLAIVRGKYDKWF